MKENVGYRPDQEHSINRNGNSEQQGPYNPPNDEYVRIRRDGPFVEREFVDDKLPSTTKVVFVGKRRFVREADGVFRADSDATVLAQEEQYLNSMRGHHKAGLYLRNLRKNVDQATLDAESKYARQITIDGREGWFNPYCQPLLMIEGKQDKVDGQVGWFYPYTKEYKPTTTILDRSAMEAALQAGADPSWVSNEKAKSRTLNPDITIKGIINPQVEPGITGGKKPGEPRTDGPANCEGRVSPEDKKWDKKRRWFLLAFQELIGNSQFSPTPANFFEEGIYRHGTFKFDRDKFNAKTRTLLRLCELYSQVTGENEKKTYDDLVKQIQYDHYTMLWQQNFSRKIPKGWDDSNTARLHALGVTGDISDGWDENAVYSYLTGENDENNRPLGPYLVSVCITHPAQFVACTVGVTYRLNQKQFTWLIVRPDVSGSKREQVIVAQRQMGATEKEIEASLRMAEKAHERMNEAASTLANERKPGFLQ